MKRWISAKDELPEDDVTVVLYDVRNEDVALGFYDEGTEEFVSSNSCTMFPATHWIEVP